MKESLGHYKILRKIGSGGMGEVYAAEDSKLGRQVAIKVLPADMAAQPERVQRFEREARAVAALDHPNIVTIHSVEEADGLHFITMQLVEGEALSEKIPRKGFSLETFFDVAIPMADAISAAHEQGITHRDLKPQNVMVADDGQVKILDFGLAKLRDDVAAADGPTVISDTGLTGEGKIMGTVAYMSPEQAEGKTVDHRSDIFSLGIVLYEMATGERPFKGDTGVSVISSIVKDTPVAINELNTALPRHLGRIVRHCLAKDADKRFHSAADVRNELAELRKEVDSGEIAVATIQAGRRRWAWPLVAGLPLIALLLVLYGPDLVLGGEGSGPVIAKRTQLTDLSAEPLWPSLSPDGEYLLYDHLVDGDREVFRQRVGGAPRPLTDNDGWDSQATFAPDGERIAFRSNRRDSGIFVMGATGESPRLVTEDGFNPAWSPDGQHLAYSTVYTNNPYARGGASSGELWVVEVATREGHPVYQEPDIDALQPSWSPDGNRIAFWGLQGGQRDIWTIPATGGDPVPVTEDIHTDWGPCWSPDGSYLYFLSDRGPRGKPDLWRVPMDQGSGTPVGPPEAVWAPDVGRVIQASISGDKIVCTLELVRTRIVRREFDPVTGTVTGREDEIHATGNQILLNLSLSPDGQWISFSSFKGVEDVFVMRPDGSGLLNLTEDRHRDRWPTWYPDIEADGDLWLTFASNRNGPDYQIYAIRPNGTELRQLTRGPQSNSPRWIDRDLLSVQHSPLRGTQGLRVYEFPDGLSSEPIGPGQGSVRIRPSASFSPDRQVVVQVEGFFEERRFRVFSMDPSRGINHLVRDANGDRFFTAEQYGNRWLDDRRFIFWDENGEKVYLWDIELETATEVIGLTKGQYVFSTDGRTIYILSATITSDIWMLEVPR